MSALVVEAAREWLGTPYRHQGSVPGAGCDCLGLVRGVWRALYGTEPMALPPYRADMRDVAFSGALQEAAERLLRRCEGPPRAGQVVLFRLNRAAAPKHCGIMVSDERFIHAQERIGVVEASLSESWARRVAGLYSFPDRGKAPSPGPSVRPLPDGASKEAARSVSNSNLHS